MKTTESIIFKFWLINLFMIIVLYIGYRIYISQIETSTENTLETIVSIFEILLHLGFSLVFIAVLLISSLSIFLNNFEKILKNKIYSAFTFFCLPILAILALDTMFYIDELPLFDTITAPFNIFILLYIIVLIIEFTLFRKQIKRVIEAKQK